MMPNYTETLKLMKPGEDEFYNIAVANANMDALDSYIKELREQNALLREDLANKANLGAAEELFLSAPSGFELFSNNPFRYRKNPFNEITLTIALRKLTDTAVTDGFSIATLPVGYRPNHVVSAPGYAHITGQGANANLLYFLIRNDGNVEIYILPGTDSDEVQIFGNVSFVAAP